MSKESNNTNFREESLVSSPSKADIHYTLGCDYWDIGCLDLAIDELNIAIQLDPTNPHYYECRGRMYGEEYEYENSVVDFSKAIGLDGHFAGAYHNRGLSYYRMGMLEEAIADFNNAIEIEPDIALFYSNRGLAHYYNDDPQKAIEDFSIAIELGPDDPYTYSNRGKVFAANGDLEKAMADFEEAVSSNPNDMIAYGNFVWASRQKEECVSDNTCVECSAKIGQIHTWACDNEICPFCGGQLMTCDCVNNLMDIVLNRTDADTVDCFTPSEKRRWVDLIGDLRFRWQEVLDSPYETVDMYFDSPPDWCTTYEQFEAFKKISQTFMEVDEALDYKFEELCNEKGRIPFSGYDSD